VAAALSAPFGAPDVSHTYARFRDWSVVLLRASSVALFSALKHPQSPASSAKLANDHGCV